MRKPYAAGGGGATMQIPDALPKLRHGTHQENDRECSPMEAACWLAGEPWSNRPRSVHPVIVAVAIATSEQIDADAHRQLWPLILASICTRRRFRFVLTWRLRRIARRSRAITGDQLLALWSELLDEYERRSAPGHIRDAVGRFVSETLLDGQAFGVPFFY